MNRLRRRAEFQRVYTEGVKVIGQYLVVFLLAEKGCDCRLGITATRKIGGAVVRNRARRRVRELFRRHREAVAGWSGDLVINVRLGCAGAAWGELEEDYLRCLERGKLRALLRASQ